MLNRDDRYDQRECRSRRAPRSMLRVLQGVEELGGEGMDAVEMTAGADVGEFGLVAGGDGGDAAVYGAGGSGDAADVVDGVGIDEGAAEGGGDVAVKN